MQRTTPLAQQRAVGHLLGQRVLEGVLHLRKRWLLVDEFPGLQPRQQALRCVFGLLDDAREQAPGKCLADYRQGLQQRFLGRLQAVDAGGEHPLHGGRDVQHGRDLLETVMPALAAQHLPLDQRLHHFLDEERIAFGLLQDQVLERGESGGVAQQGSQQFLGFGFAQRIEPQLGVVALAAPVVPVLGPVIDQQQDAGAGHALAENAEESLGLTVEPLQILNDQFQRLGQALAHQQPLDRLERALPADLGVHLRQRRARLGGAQQVEQIGQAVFQRAVQGQHLAGELFAPPALIVLRRDLAVVP
ncbi:hypothetical protein D3C72_1371070 [compost metagenome]